MKPVGVILAGGRSSRMGGGQKGLLPVQGVPMLARVLATLKPQTEAVLISSNGEPALFAAFDAPVLPDSVPDYQGPLAGLLTGMLWARQQHPLATHLVSAPCDSPDLPTDLCARLAHGLSSDSEIAIARDAQRIHPTLGLWPIALADSLATALVCQGMRRMQAWLMQLSVREVEFDTACLRNINTPEDLAKLNVGEQNIGGPASYHISA